MKGELLDNKKKNIEDVRTLEDYKEQIQICVANPGRFRASWTLLVILFGEAELYNYINKNAWNKKELKKFEINENY
ncbi:hypothetical protein Mgra_00003549 [Meloidogyne graminicola]|uniref:Uncharacterized protein n=1 Tax=Meloidogyne graminicola TaxID=189291 RepID=A0A8S9ZUP6_9BILA|nr:hypothetical protein Mgra_00003549 [Meloidogyne graminicola]